ncbi:uncharacterized protein LOC131088295 isoform X9 [Melospiza georgiana]|uniref:uncharacterized protein LOC131088295 isoform X9 n=1 Tax=Melospiza georgiana TaxID=44398 RepID=UPI0025AC1D06|nr:uncharacterized protein LOC131088295 isoform X9 [Melospiza georgiana]
MPGTATGDEVSGKTSPLDGRHKVLKPLEPPADASAGRTFPVPLLVPSPKPGSHRRGPPTGKYKSTTEKKAHEPSEYMRQRTKEMQQAGKEADGEAAMKAQFPGGSSGSLTASAAGREAMPGTATGDELARKISPLDWLNKVLKPLETRTDASAGRTFPVPLLVPSPKPGSHRRGPLRGKKKATGHKEADEPNNILKQMVEELHKGNGMILQLHKTCQITQAGKTRPVISHFCASVHCPTAALPAYCWGHAVATTTQSRTPCPQRCWPCVRVCPNFPSSASRSSLGDH